MNKKTKDYIVIGFALFSLFFGAGNLIFPPELGRSIGSSFYLGIIGFCITGVLVPLLGLMASIKSHGNFEELFSKVGKNFSKVFSVILVLLIGPLIAIPRTAATTFSLAIKPNFPHVTMIEFLIIFLLIDFFLVIRPSGIIELVGTYLTPILLIILLTLIIKGVISPISTYSTTTAVNCLPKALTDGYETMDTIASIIFASLIMHTIKEKGYKHNEKIKVVIKSSFVAILGLSTVYGGLIYLGSKTGSLALNMSDSQLLIFLAHSILGNLGTMGIELVLAIGCIATSVGLLSASGDFFVRISNNKIKYNVAIVFMLVITGLLASAGLTKIISVSTIVLNIVYPVTMVIILLNLIKTVIRNDFVFKACTYLTLLISLLNAIPACKSMMNLIPLNSDGFGWIIPFILVFLITNYIPLKKNNTVINSNN
ncbi:MAG: branched-chain amino acid transport system II carrier protein [Sarcina sp.]